MTRLTAIVLALCVIGAAVALHAQNRIASGSTYHTIQPRNIMPYSMWTACVFWATCDGNPSNSAVWTVESFGGEGATKNNATQSVVSARPQWLSGATNGNGCLSFGGVDDFVTIPDTWNPGNGNYTLTMWIKPNAQAIGCVVSKRNNDTPLIEFNVFCGTNIAQCTATWFTTNGVTSNLRAFPSVPASGQWSFLAIVQDSSGSLYRVHLNAADVNTAKTITVTDSISPVRFGARHTTAEVFYNGLIDAATWYSIALTSNQLEEIRLRELRWHP